MKFEWSHHAQFRLHERGISIDDVKKVLTEPDFTRHLANDKLAK